jgi:polyhydroxyalkanoate synthesis repressor PhaR
LLIIRKYPNRRLYDTAKSSYITLEDVKQLVLENSEFKVLDSKTDEDLTKGILLQIITEQEGKGGDALLTDNVLKQLIRFYGSGMHGMLREYIDQSLSTFMEQQDVLQQLMRNMIEANPLNVMGKLVGQNLNAWKSLTGFDKWGKSNPPPSEPESKDS